MAEGERFERSRPFGPSAFEAAPFDQLRHPSVEKVASRERIELPPRDLETLVLPLHQRDDGPWTPLRTKVCRLSVGCSAN